MLQRRKEENLKFMNTLSLATHHLKRNVAVSADALSRHGANMMFAYRGFMGITVQQHLYVRHRIMLKYPQLPCVVQFGGNSHQDNFPLELLHVVSKEQQFD
ncbi:hypothetical protein niasHT_010998 [Heterodera trifolii]|uniref:Uncharacterized protein n=1 Tax=Heterodera trifolii TaxID=157864 RepID=A0ABD2LG80_9BILA